MHDFFFWLAGTPPPVSASISAETIPVLVAIVIGMALGVIHAYSMSRDKAYDIQYNAVANRLRLCEQACDAVREERDEYRERVADRDVRIAELEIKYEGRRHDAGPESR